MEISFINYEESDREYIWKVYRSLMKAHIERIWGWDEKWQLNNFKESLQLYTTFIISSGRESIGYVQYKVTTDSVFISMLIIEGSHQNNGAGKKVLDKVYSLYPAMKVNLRCFRVNKRAYNFYLNNGFVLESQDNEFFSLSKST